MMSNTQVPERGRECHFCQTLNPVERELCMRCGMALPEPRSTRLRRTRRLFLLLFAGIVLFCAVMIWYLPR
jgi:uncharacterized paraquat-inducible protein A